MRSICLWCMFHSNPAISSLSTKFASTLKFNCGRFDKKQCQSMALLQLQNSSRKQTWVFRHRMDVGHVHRGGFQSGRSYVSEKKRLTSYKQRLTTSGIPFLNSAMVTDPQWGQLGGCVPSNQMAGQAPNNLLPFTWIVKLLLFTCILCCFNQPGRLGYSYSPEQLFKSYLLLQAWWLWLQHSPCL